MCGHFLPLICCVKKYPVLKMEKEKVFFNIQQIEKFQKVGQNPLRVSAIQQIETGQNPPEAPWG